MSYDPVHRYEANVLATAQTAVEVGQRLATAQPFNYEGAEFYMRAFAGMYTVTGQSGLTAELYDKLPGEAREASRDTAIACEQYLGTIGLADKVSSSIEVLVGKDTHAVVRDRFFIGATHIHVSTKGILGHEKVGNVALPPATRSPYSMTPAQPKLRSQMITFYEGKLRDVVQIFGMNLGTLVKGYVDVAPLTDDLGVVRYVDNRIGVK